MEKEKKGLSIASMVLGIVAIVLFCVMPISIICATCAVTFGVIGINKGGKGMAITGITLGIISVVLTVVIFIIPTDIEYNYDENDAINIEHNVDKSKQENSDSSIKAVVGTWQCTDSIYAIDKYNYSVTFKLDEDMNFLWGKYEDTDRNYVVGKYTFKDLHKTNHGKTAKYYEIKLDGEEFYIDGQLQDEEYGNTYEMGVVENENSAALASTISGSLYFCTREEP